MAMTLSPQSSYAIFCHPHAEPPVQFAAQELSRYFHSISGAALPIVATAEAFDRLQLIVAPQPPSTSAAKFSDLALSGDAFAISVQDDVATLRGGNPRAVLYAAYALLEEAGCRWLLPGDEVIPRQSPLILPDLERTEAPAFAFRDFGEDAGHVPVQDPAWRQDLARDDLILIDWLAKNRISGFCRFRWAVQDDSFADVALAMQQRGILALGGGHIIPQLLPRDLFAEHPEYFRQNPAGQRIADGNLCVSNAAALAILRANALTYVRGLQAIGTLSGLLNVWAEDARGGGWCSCPDCQDLTPQDQYLIVCNQIAEALSTADLSLPVDCIAYYDTLEPNTRIEPHPSLHLNYAPRLRCYRHVIDDRTCELNTWHRENLEKWLTKIPGERLDIFEYWGDCILYRSFAVPLTRVIQGDLRYYAARGSQRVMFLMMGAYSALAYPLNYIAFARLAWDPSADLRQLLDQACATLYGPAAPTMREFWDQFERAVAPAVGHGDITSPPLAHDPLADRLVSDLRQGLEEMTALEGYLADAQRQSADPLHQQRVQDALWMWRFTQLEMHALYHQTQGQYHLATAIDGAIGNAVARQPDGRFRRFNSEKSGYDYTSDPPEPRGYAEALEAFDQAINLYQQGFQLLTEGFPSRLRSSWIQTDFGARRQHESLIRRLNLYRYYCQERQSWL